MLKVEPTSKPEGETAIETEAGTAEAGAKTEGALTDTALAETAASPTQSSTTTQVDTKSKTADVPTPAKEKAEIKFQVD